MTTQTASFSRHLDDAELVRHIDDEGDALERERRTAHLRECIACTREVALLDGQSQAVSGWLERADAAPLPASRAPRAWTDARHAVQPDPADRFGRADNPRRPDEPVRPAVHVAPAARGERQHLGPATPLWLRLAASLVLVAAPLAAVTPVREWIGDRVAAIRSAESPASTLDAGAEPAVGAPQQAIVRFVPTGGRFTLVLGAAQASGTLNIERATGAEVLLESDHASVPTLVSANLLRIENLAESGASYTLALPASISELEIVVAGRTTLLERTALDASRTIPLTP